MWGGWSSDIAGLALVGFALALLAYLAYGAYLLRSRAPHGLFKPLMLAVVASAAWGGAGLSDLLLQNSWTWPVAVSVDQLRYVAWGLFVLSLLPDTGADRDRRSRLLAWLRGGMTVVGLLCALGAALGARSESGLRVVIALQLAWSVLGLVLLEQLFRNQADSTRWAMKPLCLGLGGLFAYDLYVFALAVASGRLDGDAMSARPLVHAVVVPLLVIASQRGAPRVARVQVSKVAAFYSASLLLVGAYLLFVAAAGYYVKYFGGSWGGALQVLLLTGALMGLVVMVLSGTQRARVRVFLSKHFFRYRYDYRLEWLRFTNILASRSTPNEVGALVARGLADMVESPSGGVWFKVPDAEHYIQSAVWNMPRTAATELVNSALCKRMREHEWIVDLSGSASGAVSAEEANLAPPWLMDVGSAWLAVPLLVGEDMLGFVVLGRPRIPMELDWEVRDLLKTAARQGAGFLAMMHATEALLESRKFDAFNRMSAFVVHDLKNIITQLSLMLRNAERHGQNPEFQRDMLSTVENSLDKMRQLMVQLREGERPADGASGVDLHAVLQRLQASARQRGRDVELMSVDRVATRGHAMRIERVIGHMLQNALDATDAQGRVWLELRRSAGQAVVVVGDTGVGMSQEFIQTRLFRPFSSTKVQGMGIGAYESHQYLKELGGKIEVQSEVGQGSLVTLSMPLFEMYKGADIDGAQTRAGMARGVV